MVSNSSQLLLTHLLNQITFGDGSERNDLTFTRFNMQEMQRSHISDWSTTTIIDLKVIKNFHKFRHYYLEALPSCACSTREIVHATLAHDTIMHGEM